MTALTWPLASPLMEPLVDPDFWRGPSVLVTGDTSFKGAWLALWPQAVGTRVTGLANGVPTQPSLYELARVGERLEEVHADVRDHAAVLDAVGQYAQEVVIHMAAQAFVRRSFTDPRTTYETNVMGTVNRARGGPRRAAGRTDSDPQP